MKRRDFIKVTAKGGAVAALSPGILGLALNGRALGQEATYFTSEGLADEMIAVMETALSRGGQYADVYLEEVIRTGIRLVDGKVEAVEFGVDRGGGVRLISDWKTGYAFCDSWDGAELKRVAKVASQLSKGGTAPGIADLRSGHGGQVVAYEIAPDIVESARKVEAVIEADRVARAYDSAIKQVKIDYRDEMKRVLVCNSKGVMVKQEIPLMWLSIDTLAQRGQRRHPGYVRRSEKKGFEYATSDFITATATEGARQAVAMLEAGEAPRGEIPVVIGSGEGVVFHEAVGHGLEADGIEKKTSFYTGMMGSTVGSKHITLVDDGSMANMRGSFDFDDEGTASGPTVLIDRGVLKGYMYDLLTAWKLKAEPTGNGRRESYMHYPLVRMTNTYIQPGTHSPEEIIEATQKGIYAKHLGGGEVDTATGNFTFGVREAYLIEKGRLTTPVRGANLMGNGPEILKRIDMVADDIAFWPGTCGKGQWVPVTSGAPTLRILAINVGGRG